MAPFARVEHARAALVLHEAQLAPPRDVAGQHPDLGDGHGGVLVLQGPEVLQLLLSFRGQPLDHVLEDVVWGVVRVADDLLALAVAVARAVVVQEGRRAQAKVVAELLACAQLDGPGTTWAA